MIVQTNLPYNSKILENDIYSLLNTYPFISASVIGYSFLGTPIHCLKIGNGSKEVFYSGSFHANEWIVSPVLMKFVEDFCSAIKNNTSIYGFNAQNIANSTSIYIVPMVNPDGVDLVTNFINTESNPYIYASIIANNYTFIPFPSGWKANINGVDLNLQFPARLGASKKNKILTRF